MTATPAPEVELTRPAPAAQPGPLDSAFYDLVERRFRRIVRENPVAATYLGIHTEDERLGDGTRDAVLEELEAERRHLAEVEAIDPARLSPEARFERDLEIHNLRQEIFRTDVIRTWERRSTALDVTGDGLFLLFARDFAPLFDRLKSIAGRLEAVPRFLEDHRTRPAGPQVRLWQGLEIETAGELPSFLAEIVAAGKDLPAAVRRRLETAADGARKAIGEYGRWLEASLPGGTDDWALGRERYDQLLGLRAFDGLDSDAILEIGYQQLAENKAARVAAAREIDPKTDEPTVIDRIKNDHPTTFEEALEAYRVAMLRSRQHLIDRDIVTVPKGERIDVVPTPDYLRNVVPFAAYFEPPKFDRDPSGIYIVTSSVNNDPSAMREHNYSS
ncbi:MAG: DUF885 domain-containing protein, partial [Chloroflexota bacterium]|nr:DUF885 domain-containing protein [Chloroflexota bacterium]